MSDLSDILEKLSLAGPSADSDSDENLLEESINNNKTQLETEGKLIKELVIQVDSVFNKNNQVNMPNEIFKAEYLNCIPDFDGNPNELGRYLATCESILAKFYNRTDEGCFHNSYLLHSFLSKLKGNARLVINIHNVETWDDLKSTLQRNFADQRDETCLNRDLVLMKQNINERPQQFYDRILNILNLLCSYVNCHEATDPGKRLKRDLYQNLALKTFLSGLREPLGTTIRCMKPNSLSQALQFVIQEDNAQYFQAFTNKNIFKNPDTAKHSNPGQNSAPINPAFNPNFAFGQNRQNFPSQPIHVQPRPNFQQRIPTNIPAFRQPQRNINVFRPNPHNRNFSPPTPMSGVSVQRRPNQYNTPQYQQQPSTSHQTPNYQRFPQGNVKHYNNSRNHLVFEELNNTETNENPPPDYEYQNYYDPNEQLDYLTEQPTSEIDQFPEEHSHENFPETPQVQDET